MLKRKEMSIHAYYYRSIQPPTNPTSIGWAGTQSSQIHNLNLCHPSKRLFADQFQFTLNISVNRAVPNSKTIMFYSSSIFLWHVENIFCAILDQKVERFVQGVTSVARIKADS